MTSAFAAFINLSSCLPGLMRARPVFYRETASLLYHPWAQLLAWVTAEVPWIAGILLVGPTLAYYMIGFGGGGAAEFWTAYLTLYVLVLACVLLGATVANALPSLELAQAALGIITPILMLYGGLYSKVELSACFHRTRPGHPLCC